MKPTEKPQHYVTAETVKCGLDKLIASAVIGRRGLMFVRRGSDGQLLLTTCRVNFDGEIEEILGVLTLRGSALRDLDNAIVAARLDEKEHQKDGGDHA